MSLAHLKLNPAIARETPRGEVMCLVCNLTVKPKLWHAHMVGKKHRESSEKLKKQLSGGTIPQSLQKRPPIDSITDPSPAKKTKVGDDELPSDFFESSGGSTAVEEIPWQRARKEQNEIVKERKGLIEGLPQGFFDDKAKDMKVRETAEKDEHMEADYEKLMREIAEQDQEKELVREKEEDADMRQRELDYIDEQMERLKELNELEKKRDAILEGRKMMADTVASRKKEAEDDEDEDDMVDFDDWRSMSALR